MYFLLSQIVVCGNVGHKIHGEGQNQGFYEGQRGQEETTEKVELTQKKDVHLSYIGGHLF